MSKKHAPNRVDTYFTVHENFLDQLRSQGVVVSDTLTEKWDYPPMCLIEGEALCRGGLRLSVRKVLYAWEERGTYLIQTLQYSYNLSLPGQGNIFRYDNCHAHPGHVTSNHVHRFDPPGTEIADSPIETGDDWPTLGEVFLEADRYYWEHLHAFNSAEE